MTAQRLAGELPHARLRLISDAGHHLPRRAPAAVAEAIAAFVATLDQTGDSGPGDVQTAFSASPRNAARMA
jgi:hypothetical protein